MEKDISVTRVPYHFPNINPARIQTGEPKPRNKIHSMERIKNTVTNPEFENLL